MKVLTKGVLFGAMTVAVVATQAFMCSDRAEAPLLAGGAPGFAVVELFTSEGCSSCPPADQLVARLQKEDKEQPVYILAFHVDYWDRMGWKDAFSDALYTQRQNQYASWLKLSSIYTPQVVVNGRSEMVGSQEAALRKAIDNGLGLVPAEGLSLSGVRQDNGKVAWHYQVSHPGKHQALVVALVQKTATTSVKAGENSGRTLSHVQLVRELATGNIGPDGSGTGYLPVPAAIGPDELIAFVQDSDSGQILAAARASIP